MCSAPVTFGGGTQIDEGLVAALAGAGPVEALVLPGPLPARLDAFRLVERLHRRIVGAASARRQAAIGSFFVLAPRGRRSARSTTRARRAFRPRPASLASAVATREPGCTMLPSARRMPEASVTGMDEARLQLDRDRRDAGVELRVHGAAHHRVEHGRENPAVHGAERVVVLLARLVREDDPAGRDVGRVRSRRGRRPAAAASGRRRSGGGPRARSGPRPERGRVGGVVPADRAACGSSRLS